MFSFMPAWEAAVVLLVAFLFGALKSAFGVAGALVTPALSLIINPRLAVALLAPLALWTDFAALRHHWRKWDLARIKLMAPGVLVGTLAGTLVLRGLSLPLLNKTLAVITLGYVAVQLWQMARRAGQTAAAAEAQGPGAMASVPAAHIFALGGGVVGALSHAGGIVMTMHLMATGLRGQAFVSTLVVLFFLTNVTKLPLYLSMGILTWTQLGFTVVAVPLVFAGGAVGRRLGMRLTAKQFEGVLLVMMVLLGLLLLFK